ncbi:MAG: HAMP domain-containing histidine kinase [Lachnospiraceae bacterium]|nr:HAMP domain-containing histidine kinase [Lachnospiraceae bacterium]
MSLIQKILLILSCIFFVLTIAGGLKLGAYFAIAFFLFHSLTLILFAYRVYKECGEHSMVADTYKQDIGQELAGKNKEIENMKSLINEKEGKIIEIAREKETLSVENEELKKNLEKLNTEKEGLVREAEEREKADSERNVSEGLLPPVDEEYENSTVNIIELAKRAVNELSEDAKKVSLHVTVQSAEETLLVKADPNRLVVLFRNIIDNSIKYMNKAGSLVITISTINDDIFIVLKDTGEGLAEDETRHIFELNYQGSNRLSGNGLGLTQAKAIVDYYGGMIYAKSTKGRGMGIYIQLPA